MWLLFAMAFAARIDRIIAVVDDTVVLETDVRYAQFLADLDRSPVPFWTTGAPVQRQIEAAIIANAAGDVALYRPSEGAVRQRADALRAQFADRTAWRAFLERSGLDEASLAETLTLRMRVEAYLLRNLAPPPSNVVLFEFATRELLVDLTPRSRVRRVEDP